VKIVTVVGARPQFIKAAAISHCINKYYKNKIHEIVIHTGQHYDNNMSDLFFQDFQLKKPDYQLGIHGGKHGEMTGRMLEAIETVLISEKPDCLLIYGDTNSTLAAALAAAKLHIPIAHIEAGLRSFNLKMPEEVNRILADKLSSYLFCPTQTAINNLEKEGITSGIHCVGDVMYDVALLYQSHANNDVLHKYSLKRNEYYLATCHREENTDNPHRLENILKAFAKLAKHHPVVFPLHPRTRDRIEKYALTHLLNDLFVLPPLSYFDLLTLQQSAKAILTDSGGIQKEAFFNQVPCITLRDETEWVETLELEWNQLTGDDPEKIYHAALQAVPGRKNTFPYGEGKASQKILETLLENIDQCVV
jgi:UDP-GlcNAc3NAcA epimerase